MAAQGNTLILTQADGGGKILIPTHQVMYIRATDKGYTQVCLRDKGGCVDVKESFQDICKLLQGPA